MKIHEIQIENFGKFSNFSYKFNGSGLEILNGENEFGKTTIISFIQRVLYGFPDGRSAENLYECSGTPFGGRLLCSDDNGRSVTIERLGKIRGGTLKIFDTESGEELPSSDYIKQGAEFYRNIYMIHLKDLMDEAVLNSSDISCHLFGIERAFGNNSLQSISNTLKTKSEELFTPRGHTRIIHKLAGKLADLEKKRSDLNTDIEGLSSENTDIKSLDSEQEKLRLDIAKLKKIEEMHLKYEEAKKKSTAVYDGELPDLNILAKKNEINSLVERRSSIAESFNSKPAIEKKIAALENETSALAFASEEEFNSAVAQYENEIKEYSEKLIRIKLMREEYEKRLHKLKKIRLTVLVMAAFFALIGIAGIVLTFYYAAILLAAPAVLLFLRKPEPDTSEEPAAPADRTPFFAAQRSLFAKKQQLEQYRFDLSLLERKLNAFAAEVKVFSSFLPETFSPDLGNEIKTLQQKLEHAARCEVRLEVHKKAIAAAAAEAENIKKIIDLAEDKNTSYTDELCILNEKLENIIRQRGELALKLKLKENKLAELGSVESSCRACKAELNKLCREHLKWNTAFAVLQKTIGIFEEDRQGEVMQNASKYFAELTGNAYTSIRKTISTGALTVFNSAENKTVRQLSSGTREQLLFVIRLALIEYIEKNTITNLSMPLLMDDIFVNYDDTREKAAWKILKKFSQKRQIIFCRAKNTDPDHAENNSY